MKKLKILTITVCIVGLAALFGCSIVQDLIPAHLSPVVKSYIDANDIPLPPHRRLVPWWDSLFDLRVVAARIEFIHQYRKMDEGFRHTFAKNVNQSFIIVGESFQEKLFSSTGPLAYVLPLFFAGPLGVFLGGKFVKSPREKELEKNNKGA